MARTYPKTFLHSFLVFGAVLALLGFSAAADEGWQDDDGYAGSYSYFRVVEGAATLIQGGSGDRDDVRTLQPALRGDRVWVAPGSKVELELADRNLLRLDGDTEVIFVQLAGSPEGDDDVTVLRLLQGNLQLVVRHNALGRELPRVELDQATVYVDQPGRYRITADRDGWTQVVVREGRTEVVAERGSVSLQQGEEAVLEGGRWASFEVVRAARPDSLERWGDYLEQAAQRYDVPYLDESLRYAAAPLAEYGEWLHVAGHPAWRPRVQTGWRPYWDGRWSYSPAGLVWVSAEPWGWVPYHYGSWDLVPGFGWVWYPGRRFAPAHVVWYWGDDYVAWYPSGYYSNYYADRFSLSFGFGGGHSGVHVSFGLFGYGGGSWDPYLDWSFCPRRYFGHHDQHRYLETGHKVRTRTRWQRVPQGYVTTDTRDLTPDTWRRPERAREVLRRQVDDGTRGAGREPLDITPILSRQDRLPEDLERELRSGRRSEPRPPVVRDDEGRQTRTPAGRTFRGRSSDGTELGADDRDPEGRSYVPPSTGGRQTGDRDPGYRATGREDRGTTSRTPTYRESGRDSRDAGTPDTGTRDTGTRDTGGLEADNRDPGSRTTRREDEGRATTTERSPSPRDPASTTRDSGRDERSARESESGRSSEARSPERETQRESESGRSSEARSSERETQRESESGRSSEARSSERETKRESESGRSSEARSSERETKREDSAKKARESKRRDTEKPPV